MVARAHTHTISLSFACSRSISDIRPISQAPAPHQCLNVAESIIQSALLAQERSEQLYREPNDAIAMKMTAVYLASAHEIVFNE